MTALLTLLNLVAGLMLLAAGIDCLNHWHRSDKWGGVFWCILGIAVIANAVRAWGAV